VYWIKEMQRMQLHVNDIHMYPIPDNVPNTISGCLIIPGGKINKQLIGKNELCQAVSPTLFIPERARLFPMLSEIEIEKMFASAVHLFHPEFGLIELTETFNAEKLLQKPVMKSYYVTKPAESIFIPAGIKSFQIEQVSPEEIIKNLEEKIFPKKEPMPDKPLTILEQGKLLLYKALLTGYNKGLKVSLDNAGEKKWWQSKVSLLNSFFKDNKLLGRIKEDFEDLEDRNRNEVEKLMDLLKSNPEEALKYAIPLNETGAARGGDKGSFSLLKRWKELSWKSNTTLRSSSGTVNLNDHYQELHNQYTATADALVKKKKYHDAAFVYMKLLKNYLKAAETLEAGGFYQEAATIYLKHAGNKQKAAECYEKGNMTLDAIAVYKELNADEKVGDLYLSISRRQEANIYYQKVIGHLSSKSQYIKASMIYKKKMDNIPEAQALLLAGWRNNKDAANCLNNYFSNIDDTKQLKNEILSIYSHDVNQSNSEPFLQVLKHEYNKQNELADSIKEMAYEIVAANIVANPTIVSSLKLFTPNDQELIKDTLRYKVQNKK